MAKPLIERLFSRLSPSAGSESLDAAIPVDRAGTGGTFSADEICDALCAALFVETPASSVVPRFRQAVAEDVPLRQALEQLLHSHAFREEAPRFVKRYRLDAAPLTVDYSQFGEIALLLQLINTHACPDRYIVDAGVLGIEGSNSYNLLRDYGWRGLLIEANPDLAEHIHKVFAGTDYRLVSCAVGTQEGDGVLTLGVINDVSSLDRDFAEIFGPGRGEVKVQVRRLQNVLQEYEVPHDFSVLSLDIEGQDIGVLNDLIDNSPWRPRWVIVEASFSYRTTSLHDLEFSDAVRAEYQIAAQTIPNLILAHRCVHRPEPDRA